MIIIRYRYYFKLIFIDVRSTWNKYFPYTKFSNRLEIQTATMYGQVS